jgi:hypothetical protein
MTGKFTLAFQASFKRVLLREATGDGGTGRDSEF